MQDNKEEEGGSNVSSVSDLEESKKDNDKGFEWIRCELGLEEMATNGTNNNSNRKRVERLNNRIKSLEHQLAVNLQALEERVTIEERSIVRIKELTKVEES